MGKKIIVELTEKDINILITCLDKRILFETDRLKKTGVKKNASWTNVFKNKIKEMKTLLAFFKKSI